jgi:hypothetical protein
MTDLPAQIEAAIRRGTAFLQARQAPDGSWTDWELPPGPSTAWTTAYVGLRLTTLRAPALGPPLARAGRWLLAHRFPDGGWGYSPAVESDADTTSLALLLLAALGTPAPPQAHAFLRGFQREDGGFSTFRPDGLAGSWGNSHPEITPVAVMALRAGCFPSAAQARAFAAIRRARRPDGLWDAFWWASPLPATEANLACLAARGRLEPPPDALLALPPPEDALQAALLLSLSAVHAKVERLTALSRPLLTAQAGDGAWASAASLRIPSRSVDRPWDGPATGPLYADPKRLFTTATALAALARARRQFAVLLRRGSPGQRRQILASDSYAPADVGSA